MIEKKNNKKDVVPEIYMNDHAEKVCFCPDEDDGYDKPATGSENLQANESCVFSYHNNSRNHYLSN